MKKVAIIGYGYVGRGMYKIFDAANVYDPNLPKEDKEKFEKEGVNFANKTEVNKCDLAVICVPTPTSNDGMSCDTSIVESVFDWLKVPLVIIKSTGKTRYIRYACSKVSETEHLFFP